MHSEQMGLFQLEKRFQNFNRTAKQGPKASMEPKLKKKGNKTPQ